MEVCYTVEYTQDTMQKIKEYYWFTLAAYAIVNDILNNAKWKWEMCLSKSPTNFIRMSKIFTI